MTIPTRQDTIDLVSRAAELLPTQSVMRGCLLVCTFLLLLRWLTWRGASWRDQQATVIAFCLSILLHLCLWMGCTVLTEAGVGNRPSGMVASTEEEPIPIRQFIEEGEPQFGQSSDSTATGRAVWDKVLTPGSVTRERNRPVQAAREPSTLPQRETAPIETARREVPDLPNISAPTEGDAPAIKDRPPEKLASLESSQRAPATAEVEEMPVDETGTETAASSDTPPPRRAFERSNQVRASSATQSTTPQTGRDPQRESTARGQNPGISRGLLSSMNDLSVASMAGDGEEMADGIPEGRGNRPGRAPAAREGSFGSRTGSLNDRNRVAVPANSVQTILTGLVTDSETGRPLGGALVRIDRVDLEPLTTQTLNNGLYRLAMTELPDNVAVTVTRKGYLPESRNLGTRASRLDFALDPIDESIISIEQKPEVHHLGNDVFSGEANSQFQRKTEGGLWTAKFTFTPNQLQFKPKSVTLSFLAKGMQYPPKLRINGLLLAQPSPLSPADGSFGNSELKFAPYQLKPGENEITVQAAERNGDQDDFEFVNIQLRFNRTQ